MFYNHLRLLYGGVVSITHWGDVHACGPLLVALLEELLHDPFDPELVSGQGLGRVGEVGAVDHVLQHLYPVRVVVQEEDPGARNLLGLHHGLEVRQEAHVLGHVCG